MNKKMIVNEKEYEIIKLLGKGKGGYSYLADDGVRKFVLKQIHHAPCDYYQFGNKIEAEISDYNRLREIRIKIPAMIDVDIGNERILKEYIEGDTIYELVLQDRMKSSYLDQLHSMCEYAGIPSVAGNHNPTRQEIVKIDIPKASVPILEM